jgi:hypothetical protein
MATLGAWDQSLWDDPRTGWDYDANVYKAINKVRRGERAAPGTAQRQEIGRVERAAPGTAHRIDE